jgi:outer membrane protein assembly factor BamB
MKTLSQGLFIGALAMSLLSPSISFAQVPAPDNKKAHKSKLAPTKGWLQWRGPNQDGTSSELNLPEDCKPDGKNLRWTLNISGRGTPVIAGSNVYVWGYRGENEDLREYLLCVDRETGQIRWEKKYSDFLSDIIYNRYAIGSPSVDAETGNVYLMTSPGLLLCYSASGKMLWQRSMMEDFGRLTFPNGRTGAPTIDGDLVIVTAITSNWGRQGPAKSRFYAFEKKSGELVWASSPGLRPRDSTFSTPIFEWRNGKRVFYAGTGCGHVVCVNVKTGKPLWRFPMSFGGVNSSVLLYKDSAIAIHGRENRDSSTVGRMVSIKLGVEPAAKARDAVTLGRDHELWRADIGMFTSSPVIVKNRIYQVTSKGVLVCLDADKGVMLWKKKLDNAQLHASPLYADGKLYIPLWSGDFYIIRPSDKGPEILQKVKLEGKAIGSPSVYCGRIFVHTTKKLYCFGAQQPGPEPTAVVHKSPAIPKIERVAHHIQIVPSEVLLQPGQSQKLTLRLLNKNGRLLKEMAVNKSSAAQFNWKKYVPATAKVKAYLDAHVVNGHVILAKDKAKTSAGAYRVQFGEYAGTLRGRVLARLPMSYDFEQAALKVAHKSEKDVKFAYPPLAWIGARFKWEIRERDGSKVLSKTLDRVLFQRSSTFIGSSKLSNYTMEADVLSDGSRRLQSSIGLINQRYIIVLDGNWQRLEINSNHDRFKVHTPFKWKTKKWYRLKTRIDLNKDGSGVIRAKAWLKGTKEPVQWTLEAKHDTAHQNGAPGFFAFSPQGRYRVYMDNVSVMSNK